MPGLAGARVTEACILHAASRGCLVAYPRETAAEEADAVVQALQVSRQVPTRPRHYPPRRLVPVHSNMPATC